MKIHIKLNEYIYLRLNAAYIFLSSLNNKMRSCTCGRRTQGNIVARSNGIARANIVDKRIRE